MPLFLFLCHLQQGKKEKKFNKTKVKLKQMLNVKEQFWIELEKSNLTVRPDQL